MKTVVITGSARGFGFEMAKEFKLRNLNVVICDINKECLNKAKKELEKIDNTSHVLSYNIDITNEDEVSFMIKDIINKFNTIDIWINNAGVNQENKPLWEIDSNKISRLLNIDLKGTIICSKLIMPIMIKQNDGFIYNVEGFGSDDAKMLGLSIYGTSKRAVTYFTESLALESKLLNTNVKIGKITPGIMITNFIDTSLGDGDKIYLDERTKKVYNILGDYPDVIAKYMVNKILKNKKNNSKITWLTKRKAFSRFLLSPFNKNDYFKEK